MADQLARGLFARFGVGEHPFQSPNGMEDNLRLIDDHLGLYTLDAPVAAGTDLPTGAPDGAGQIYTDGTYAVLNGGIWKTYPARRGVFAQAADRAAAWMNSGVGWIALSLEAALVLRAGGGTMQSYLDATHSRFATAAAIQAAIDSWVVDGETVNRGWLGFQTALAVQVNQTVSLNRKTFTIEGKHSVFTWGGNNSTPMFDVVDAARGKFKDMVIIGSYASPPTAAIRFRGVSGSPRPNNENCVVDGVVIGRKFTVDTSPGGSIDPAPYGRFQTGILVDGDDGDNDEYEFKNTLVHSCDGHGFSFQNTQSIWSKLDNTLVNDCGGGVNLGCNLNMYNVNFNRIRDQDILGFRDLESYIYGLNSENSKICVKSLGGASFFMYAMWVRRDNAIPSNFLRWENGGTLWLEGGTFSNAQAAADTIYYRPGSLKGGVVRVRGATITNGAQRSTWDIDTNLFTALHPEIDIEHGAFQFKTTRPYADKAVTPALTSAGGSTAVSADTAIGVLSPFGNFYNVSYALSLQGQHLTSAPASSSQLYGRILNPSGAGITLAAARMRWLDVNDRVVAQGSASIDVPSVANGAGHTATIPVPGVQLGDFIIWSADAAFPNFTVAAYVSAEDTCALRFHNASGGVLDPAATTLRAAKLSTFGRFQAGSVYTPAAIANGGTVTIAVPVAGAQIGGHTFVSYTKDLQGLICTAYVSAADTVTVVLSNYTGSPVTLAAGSFKVMVAF